MRPAVAALLLTAVLAACGGPRVAAPVAEQGRSGREPEAPLREVRAGDTLYSIAWESGRDYRDLAAWNRIAPPYVIKPGQMLRLYPPQPEAKRAGAARFHSVRPGETLQRIAATNDVELKDLAAWNNLAPPYRLRPGQKLRLTAPETSTASTKTERAPVRSESKAAAAKPEAAPATAGQAPDKTAAASRIGPWSWPAEGGLIERFTPNGPNKGIAIAGKKGQPIYAAAAGTVVYQGGGLRGYGALIIVKHNADFLSAYAHNDKVFVKEGDVIKRGQKIAEMGSSGADRVKLHFEVRYRGAPADPLMYLPKK